ncbi:MAG: helix-turn-helix transcriptional regulator [Proteobacteria bacterium]|nr:helix-turn-helix transcriptional regulator [Pseudomonadota bacterium]
MIIQEAIASRTNSLGILEQGFGLTRREKDVLAYAIQGMRTSQISRELNISKETVKVHFHNIFQKMAISNRSDLRSLLS